MLAYWREALETPLPVIEQRITEGITRARQSQTPIRIVAGHPYDAAYTAWLEQALPQATVTVVPNSGHFPHLADPDGFARLLAETGGWGAPPVSTGAARGAS